MIASLAHTRAGIPDAIITSGAVDILIGHLFSGCPEVRSAAAVALGYLTFNRRATRSLLVATRNTPGLYERLMGNLDKDGRISTDFTDEFRRAQIVGLPALRWVCVCSDRSHAYIHRNGVPISLSKQLGQTHTYCNLAVR